ncbi:MAG: L-threonylcarbamoyladenylate synthase [Pseudomonadota bacterium]
MTKRLTSVSEAAALLRAGGLVAFATETVYGLGANARDGQAVARVYEAKGRPSFNPLIVHVPTVDAARSIAVFDDAAERLAEAFWPGPLTLVLPLARQAGLSGLVTAGLDTVAVRVPEHPVARELLAEAGVPVAAPSANVSGQVSPTTADHVFDGLSGRIDAVLDAGPCEVGLESTIVATGSAPTLLRSGGLPVEAIEAGVGPLAEHGGGVVAPGQLASHYAPGAAVRLEASAAEAGEVMLGFGPVDGARNLSRSGDLREAAANLFGFLRVLDGMADRIAVAPVPDHGLGRAINDRLRRAAAPRG